MRKRRLLSVLLVLVLCVSGCSYRAPDDADISVPTVSESNVPVSETTEPAPTPTPTSTPTPTPAPFTFNPHVHTDLLSEVATDDMWESFYNMVDAVRAGEDIFECSSERAYEWIFWGNTTTVLYPVALDVVKGAGYDNGVVKLKYTMDKDKYHEREQAFETEILRILNEAIRTDYSDFEKVMGLYEYMCKHWVYDYEDINGQDEDNFGNYACLMKKNGICCEIAYAFSYLLLQAGVEAMPFGTECEHDWTYVVIGGKGYHVDPTWGLHGDDPDVMTTLDYFMMTDEERSDDGLQNKFQAEMLWMWKDDYDITRFASTDETFKPISCGASFLGMNTDRNVISYITDLGEKKEFFYGDL